PRTRPGLPAGLARPLGRRRLRRRPRDPQLLPGARFDLPRQLGVALQELPGVVAALAEAHVVVGKPRARAGHEALSRGQIEDAARLADAAREDDVGFGVAEGRGQLVLDDPDPDPLADHLVTRLERFGAADLDPDRGVELQRAPAGRRFAGPIHHAYFLANLVDEHD